MPSAQESLRSATYSVRTAPRRDSVPPSIPGPVAPAIAEAPHNPPQESPLLVPRSCLVCGTSPLSLRRRTPRGYRRLTIRIERLDLGDRRRSGRFRGNSVGIAAPNAKAQRTGPPRKADDTRSRRGGPGPLQREVRLLRCRLNCLQDLVSSESCVFSFPGGRRAVLYSFDSYVPASLRASRDRLARPGRCASRDRQASPSCQHDPAEPMTRRVPGRRGAAFGEDLSAMPRLQSLVEGEPHEAVLMTLR